MNIALKSGLLQSQANSRQDVVQKGKQLRESIANQKNDVEGLRKAAQGFESIFMDHLLQTMRKSVPTSKLMGGGYSQKVYISMLDSEYAKMAAKNGGIGLADIIVEQMSDRVNSNPVQKGGPLNTLVRPQPSHISGQEIEKSLPYLKQPTWDEGILSPLPKGEGRLSSSFGMRIHPIFKRPIMHQGVDIAVPVGTPVHAVRGGVVAFSGEKSGYGKVMVVDHGDNTATTYAHLSSLLAEKGQDIKGGEKISLSGNSGYSTGPHLHFEVRKKGIAVEPMAYLQHLKMRESAVVKK